MTRKEHNLVMTMLGKQLQAYQCLIKALEDEGILTPDRVAKLNELRQKDFGVALEAQHITKAEYLLTAAENKVDIPSS